MNKSLPSIGIDTLRINITSTPERLKRFLLECECASGSMLSHHGLPNVLVLPNIYSHSHVSLEFSVPKVAWDKEDNTILADPNDVKIALLKLQNLTGFNTFDATVPRIDVTLSWESCESPSHYVDLFKQSEYYKKPINKDAGFGFIKRSAYELIPYDKASEREAKGDKHLMGFNISRIELRVPERASGFIMNKSKWERSISGEFYAKSLTTNEGFVACILAFQKTVTRDLRLNMLLKERKVNYLSSRSFALYQYLLSCSDESVCIQTMTELQNDGRVSKFIVREVLTNLRNIRERANVIAHAVEVKEVIDSHVAAIMEEYPLRLRKAA